MPDTRIPQILYFILKLGKFIIKIIYFVQLTLYFFMFSY